MEGLGEKKSPEKRKHHAQYGHPDRGDSHAEDGTQVHGQADFEEKEHDADFAQQMDHRVVRDQTQGVRSEQDSGYDLAQNRRLPEPRGDLAAHSGADEDGGERDQERYDREVGGSDESDRHASVL